MRFPGQLNTDINEITTNLVPFPRLHFLVPALAPLDPQPLPAAVGGASAGGVGMGAGGTARLPRAQVVRALFHDAFAPSHQLIRCDPRTGTYLAAALLLRGDVSISDVNGCMAKIQPTLRMIHFNEDGFKLGLCGAAPLEADHAVLCLANTTVVAGMFEDMHRRFGKLYGRRAMVHHYAEYMSDADAGGRGVGGGGGLFAEAEEVLVGVAAAYRELESSAPPTDAEVARYLPFA